MEQNIKFIYQALQRLTGLHRQLLDIVRQEREALTHANIKAIQDATLAKQGVIESIRQVESDRLRAAQALAREWNQAEQDVTLPKIIIAIQASDPKEAEQLRSLYNALKLLVQRITEQNADNQALVAKSIEHVEQMKRNILGSSVPKSDLYTQQGQKSAGMGGARLFSKEA